MFILLFNDLNDCLRFCDIYQYADDTVILFAASNVDEIEFAINDGLKRIESYCLTNELLLNLKPGKTEVMLFGISQRLADMEEIWKSRISTVSSTSSTLWITIFHYQVILNVSTEKHVVD